MAYVFASFVHLAGSDSTLQRALNRIVAYYAQMEQANAEEKSYKQRLYWDRLTAWYLQRGD